MWVSLHNYINNSEFADLKTMKKSSLKETVFKNMPWQPCTPRLQLFVSKNIRDTFQICWCPSMAKRLIFVTCLVENGEKCSLPSIYTK